MTWTVAHPKAHFHLNCFPCSIIHHSRSTNPSLSLGGVAQGRVRLWVISAARVCQRHACMHASAMAHGVHLQPNMQSASCPQKSTPRARTIVRCRYKADVQEESRGRPLLLMCGSDFLRRFTRHLSRCTRSYEVFCEYPVEYIPLVRARV